MKIVTRRFKGLLTIVLCVFSLSYLVINYVNLRTDENARKLDPRQENNRILVNKDVEELKAHEEKEAKQDKLAVDDKKEIKNQVKRFYAIDGNGRGSVNREVVKCSSNIEVEVLASADYARANFSYFLDSVPDKTSIGSLVPKNRQHYFMVYAMESEPHSGGGATWHNADFYMWYNLQMSFPEPATYFDVRTHLPDLLARPRVEFEHKSAGDLAPVVWVLSNCNAFNRREVFVKKLMDHIGVDSYGFCLRNKDTHTSQRMHGNVELFSKYKFVLAIENSNCDGYVTEKLVHAVASGSIPIVAGRDNKPNYLDFMPKNSYINVYDYKSVEDLVAHLKKIAASKQEYDKYIWFKYMHNYTREDLFKMPLAEQIAVAKKVLGYENEREFFNGLVAKEKSENKLCKVARYLHTTPVDQVQSEIKAKKRNRPEIAEACLPHGNLAKDFNLL